MPDTLRPLTRADAPALQALYEACSDFSMQMSGTCVPLDAARQDLRESDGATETAQTHYFGFFAPDGLLAMMEYRLHSPEPGVCFIGVLQVAPQQRNQGIGARMLRMLEDQWRQQGIRELRLAVLAESPAAQRFWQRQGFVKHGTLPQARLGLKTHVRHELRRPL